jgi:hypothetical protein
MLRSCLLDDGVALRFDVRDHLQHQFQPLQLTLDFRLQPRRQGPPVAGAQTFELRLAVGPQRLIIINAVERTQTFDAVDVLDPLLDQPLALAMQPLGVLLLDAWNAHHTAGIRFAAQMPAERALHPLDVDPVGLGGLRSTVHQQARGIKDMIVHPMRFQEMVQPEPVVTRLVSRDRLDLVDRPAEFTGNLTP